MNARQILKILHKDGWYDYDQNGSHLQLKHPEKAGKITVPVHSGNDIAPYVLNDIMNKAGLKK